LSTTDRVHPSEISVLRSVTTELPFTQVVLLAFYSRIFICRAIPHSSTMLTYTDHHNNDNLENEGFDRQPIDQAASPPDPLYLSKLSLKSPLSQNVQSDE